MSRRRIRGGDPKKKKEQAEAKKKEFRALSLEDRVALIKTRRGNSKKELDFYFGMGVTIWLT